MLLNIFERASLLEVLPREGNFITLKTLRQLRESLVPTQEEKEMWRPEINEEKGEMTWRMTDEEGNPLPQEVDIEISDSAAEIIKSEFEKLDKKNALKDELFDLYVKFVGDEGDK